MGFDGVEVSTYRQILERERSAGAPLVVQDEQISRSPPELSDDYYSWEAALDPSDLRGFQPGDVSGMAICFAAM
jgi:hypothetical protein